MKTRFHLTEDGPKRCSADPSKPGGRGCIYGAGGHFEELAAAESAFETKMGGALPEPLHSAPTPRLSQQESRILETYLEFIVELSRKRQCL